MPRRALLLASASARRADLLGLLGLEFEVRAEPVDESPRAGEAPAPLAERLARAKAAALRPPVPSPALVIAADTIVALDGTVLGKPRDEAHAARMLGLLQGRTHEVITALAIRPLPEDTTVCECRSSRVTFAAMSSREIDWYVASGEGSDKAGAYALQGRGALFVTAIVGSYTNVIGLPLEALYPHLRRFGLLPGLPPGPA